MFQRLLVPLDGSSCAEQALPIAAQIARTSGGTIFLLQVAFAPMYYPEAWSLAPLKTAQLLGTETTQGEQYLKMMMYSPVLTDIPTTGEIICGIPTQDMLIIAEWRDIDLIVVSSHGCTEFTRWMQGSLPRILVYWSRVPILIVREHPSSSLLPAATAARPFRTLVPLDGSSRAENALMPAVLLTAALASPAQGEMHLAHIIESAPETAEKRELQRREVEALHDAWDYLAYLKESLREIAQERRMKITCSVTRASDIAHTLLTLAQWGTEEFEACDLIVISTHGRCGQSCKMTGSVTKCILNASRLPILIV